MLFFERGELLGLKYGRNTYDYEEDTMVFKGSGQVVGIKSQKDYNLRFTLLFHPDFFKGSPLASKIHSYSFFSYGLYETLHLSDKEQQIIKELFSRDIFQQPII